MADDFRINTAYAEKYNKWREKEELQKLKDKYGDIALNDESSSSSESEDDVAEALTEQLEIDWQNTLAAIKKKDPKIYDKNVRFYHQPEESDVKEKKQKKKEKPMFLKDYERKVILEKGGKLSDEEDDGKMAAKMTGLSYYEEQEQIRKELIDADEEKNGDDVDDDDDDELLTKRQKTADEQAAEDKDYELWSSEHKKQSSGKLAGRELGPLEELWKDENLDEGGKYLRDYLMNERYLEKDESGVPTYEEIVKDEALSSEDEALEKQETFERKYNFRFEEPDTEFIKSYPRTLAYSVRRKDDRRVTKRQMTKMRKLEEKNKKREELAQLKNLKKREILNRLEQLKEVTGNTSVGFTEADFDGDFDAAAHDKMMQKMFNDEYYELNEETVKPKFAEDEEIDDEDWNNWQVTSHDGEDGDGHEDGYDGDDNGPHCEDEDFNMDADYDPDAEQPSGILGVKSRKKRKNKLAQALSRKKPIFDPASKTFEEYFDEYYKLDYEDIIDDLPCRFTYRRVVENDFGLSTDEILRARDKELNAWVSLKKMSQFRTDEEEKADIRKYRKKSKNVKLKYNTLASLQQRADEENTADVEQQQTGKKRKRNKKKRNLSSQQPAPEADANMQSTGGKQQKRKAAESESSANVSKKSKLSASDSQTCEASASMAKKSKLSVSDDQAGDGAIQKGDATFRMNNEMTKCDTLKVNGNGNDTVTSRKATTDKKTKQKKKKKRKRKQPIISDARLKAYGINPKKFKYMNKAEKKS